MFCLWISFSKILIPQKMRLITVMGEIPTKTSEQKSNSQIILFVQEERSGRLSENR